MKPLSFSLIFIAALGAQASTRDCASASSPTESALNELLRSNYRAATTIEEIPQPIRTTLFSLIKYDARLANPTERFNPTDYVDSRFPRRRLIAAGGTASSWFVYYEHGGRAYTRRVVVFTVKAGAAECRCAGRVDTDARGFSDLQDELRRGLVTCNPCDPSGHF